MSKLIARKRRGAKTKEVQKRCTRPSLKVFRSGLHIYGQIVQRTKLGDEVLASASTMDNELKPKLKGNKCDKAKQVGLLLAERALKKEISEVAFDRAGYRYHGRVKALADGAREGGMNF